MDDVFVRAGETLNAGGEAVNNVKLGISRDSVKGVLYFYDNVRVGEYEEEIILPESIEFEKEELYLKAGEKAQLQYKVMPEAAIAGSAAFESDDDTVVSVSNTGATNNVEGHTTTAVAMINWKNQNDIEMIYNQGWTNSRCPVASITDAGNERAFVEIQQPMVYRKCI